MRRFWLTTGAVLLAAMLPAAAAIELVLEDGRVLRGEDLVRRGGMYELTTDEGTVIPIQVELVQSIGISLAGPQPDREAPSGIVYSKPRDLAGKKIDPPTTEEQLRVLGEPVRFRRSTIDPGWEPRSALGEDVTNFNPARWVVPPTDPYWAPESALGPDVTEFNPVEWAGSAEASYWYPRDGFESRTTLFEERSRSRSGQAGTDDPGS